MSWRATIDELLAMQSLRTQGEIVAALAARGYDVTQATVSRQLAAIGAQKQGGLYRHAPPMEIGAPIHAILVSDSGGLAVVRTAPAHASVVAHVIDRELIHKANCGGVLGSIAGDDTVFVALKNAAAVGDLYRVLGWRGASAASPAPASPDATLSTTEGGQR